MPALVSIIIPHWNGIDVITDCLKSVEASTYKNFEIIVVDNNSSDDSVKHIQKHFPKVRLYENTTNEGYAGGCNRGADIAKGEYLIFLNNDTIQNADWIELLINKLESDPLAAAVQPKILNYYQKDKFDYAGAAGGEMDFLGFPFARGRIFNDREIDNSQYNNSDEIFWSSGTAFIIKKNAFDEIGKFDELFFAHMEEIDLCWRLHLAGFKVLNEPKSVVYHKNALTLPMFSEKKYYLNHRNSLIMLISNYKLPLSFYVLPIRWALDIVAVIYAILLGDWNHIKGIMKAHAWFVFHPYEIWKKRKRNKNIRKENDSIVLNKMYRGSIVYSHYILRKSNFSDLQFKAAS